MKCKNCGRESKQEDICIHCGENPKREVKAVKEEGKSTYNQVEKKGIWKEWWFWAIIVVVFIIIISASGNNNKKSNVAGTETKKEQTAKPSPSKTPNTSTPTPAASTPITTSQETIKIETQAPKPASNNGSGFSCGSKSKCGEMSSCEEAKFYLNTCGLSKLDGDKDGVPCETLCK